MREWLGEIKCREDARTLLRITRVVHAQPTIEHMELSLEDVESRVEIALDGPQTSKLLRMLSGVAQP